MAERNKEEDLKNLKRGAAVGVGSLGVMRGTQYGARKVKEAKAHELIYHINQLNSTRELSQIKRHGEAAEKAGRTAVKAGHVENTLKHGFKYAAIGIGAGIATDAGLYYMRHRNGKTERVRRPRSTSGMRNFNRLPKSHNA